MQRIWTSGQDNIASGQNFRLPFMDKKKTLQISKFNKSTVVMLLIVRRGPVQSKVTWKTPSRVAFIPLQKPVAVLASYVPHTQMPV
jgi:hypothetical protein